MQVDKEWLELVCHRIYLYRHEKSEENKTFVDGMLSSALLNGAISANKKRALEDAMFQPMENDVKEILEIAEKYFPEFQASYRLPQFVFKKKEWL